ncbi:hypothetical protein ACIQB5_06700 [Streptomyces sp. NPDC088560]|uniref:hypothetical protein n=1 Tax=Streptomyces sp. NPDC088560 TaxID=3365868 RepID=UPI0038050B25
MKLKTESQVRSAERTLAAGSWSIVFGAMLFSVLTVTPLVKGHTPAGWEWTAPILPTIVDAAVVIVVRLDSLITRLGGHGGPWSVILRWMTGLMTLTLNVGDSALHGDKVGVAIHSVAPLLLIVTAEASLAYRRAISRALARIADEQAREQAERERQQAERERLQREERERERSAREQAEREAREHDERVAREAREHAEQLERERLDREAAERQAQREHAAQIERDRLAAEERKTEAARRDQREREDREREERLAREAQERADRLASEDHERTERERAAREQSPRTRERKPGAAREQPGADREQPHREHREHPPRLVPVNTEPPKMPEAEALEAVRLGVAAGASVRDLVEKTGWSVGWVSARRRELAKPPDGDADEENTA